MTDKFRIRGVGPIITGRLQSVGINNRPGIQYFVQAHGACELLRVLGVGPKKGRRILRTIGVGESCTKCHQPISLKVLERGYRTVNEGKVCGNIGLSLDTHKQAMIRPEQQAVVAPKTKALFTGSTLEGFQEAGKVTSLDAFTPVIPLGPTERMKLALDWWENMEGGAEVRNRHLAGRPFLGTKEQHDLRILAMYERAHGLIPTQPFVTAENAPAQPVPSAPEVLVQPELVKTASIPEAIAAPKPTAFKTYAEGAHAWEVSEEDYIKHYIEKEKARLRGNIKYYEKLIAELSPKQKASKAKYEQSIYIWKHFLDRLEAADPQSIASAEHNAKNEYNTLVKEAIKHGEPVPSAVAEQKPEFQVARDARRRYEKGLHTSFANKSVAVNAVMFLEKGYKVKRQDGKEILEPQIREIDDGVNEIQQAVGPAKDIMQKTDLTIAHTSGTFPFLTSNASGVFHPNQNTITTGLKIAGVFPIRSLGHEWGHWLDYAAGSTNDRGYEFYTNGRSSKRVKALRNSLSSNDHYQGKDVLLRQAEDTMSDPYLTRELIKAAFDKGVEASGEEGKKLRERGRKLAAHIGVYYSDPREIWARLVEEYIAETNGKGGVAVETPEFYYTSPAYWSKAKFDELRPVVKAEIERRIQIARGS